MPIQKAIQSSGEILCGMMGTWGIASRLLAMVAVIGCHLMATARPFGASLATVGRGLGDRLPFDGNDPSLRCMLSLRNVIHSCKWLSLGSTCLALLDYLHWMSPFARVTLRTWDVVCFGGVGRCSTFRRTVALVMQRSSWHYTGEGCGRRNMSKEDCYLVDPASSHMLVSKIKPCMFKKLVVGPWVGSIGPPLVCTGRLVPSAGDMLLALIGRVMPPALASLPIGSRCGPMQITAAAQAQAVDMPVETSSSRLWMAARAISRASAPARSWRRPAGSPFSPS
ncbi:hypothetical protein G2W53_039946 [Senna tora]|uniref:Uncharacterized protein n=1 Tax=Senna tora TaxID=362788 RepID=A0A834W3A1_9FABA|nr:hypothetical protein G2W53_039946 [Senna tora]